MRMRGGQINISTSQSTEFIALALNILLGISIQLKTIFLNHYKKFQSHSELVPVRSFYWAVCVLKLCKLNIISIVVGTAV